MTHQPTIGVAVIVRDGAETLGRALESVRPHVDFIAVLDTGSVDDSLEIAMRYADTTRILDWSDSFAAARNHAATLVPTDWVMHVDADDLVRHGDWIRRIVAMAAPTRTAIDVPVILQRDSNGVITHQFRQTRIVRRGRYVWKGRAHEVLMPVGTHEVMSDGMVHIEHLPPPRDDAANLARNIRLLEMDLADQEVSDSRTLFYLGRDCLQAGRLDDARRWFGQYLPIATWLDEKYVACHLMGVIARQRAEWGLAQEYDLRAAALRPEWPDAYYGLAETAYFRSDWRNTVGWGDVAMDRPEPKDAIFSFSGEYRFSHRIFRAVALWNLGRHLDAVYETIWALNEQPDHAQHRHNLEFFAARLRLSHEDLHDMGYESH